MILTRISLRGFRNFENASFTVNPHTTIIIGENARGKTNLLEAVFFSMNGGGFRESKEEELLKWEGTDAYVETVWKEEDRDQLFQIHIGKRENRTEKKFYINKTHKSHFQYREFLGKAVLFAPEHIEIVTGSPDRRRDYMNKTISLFNVEYQKRLRNYEHALRRRNKVLEAHQNIHALKQELAFWDQYLLEHAAYVTNARSEYVAFLNANPELQNNMFRIEYLKNEMTRERLDHYFPIESKARKTLIGPQKDDFHIHLSKQGIEKNIHMFGSRSEQRLGVFWLKLLEIRNLEQVFKKKPLLLLDDIFSELDAKNKKLTLELASEYQSLLTTTEAELLHEAELPAASISL